MRESRADRLWVVSSNPGFRACQRGVRAGLHSKVAGRAGQDQPAGCGDAGPVASGRVLTGVWGPDATHEAVRDLVRAREAAADDRRRKRQQLLSFLLRHGRVYSDGGHWTLAHRRWLAKQSFEHPAQQIVFQVSVPE
jgi:hypothetical protein